MPRKRHSIGAGVSYLSRLSMDTEMDTMVCAIGMT